MRGAHGFPGGPTHPPYGAPLSASPTAAASDALPPTPPTGPATRPDRVVTPAADPVVPAPEVGPSPPPPPAGDLGATGPDADADPDDGLPTFEQVLAGPHPVRGGPRRRRVVRPGLREGGTAPRRSTWSRFLRVLGATVVAVITVLAIIGFALEDEDAEDLDIGGGVGTFQRVSLDHCDQRVVDDPDDRRDFEGGRPVTVLADLDVALGHVEGLGGPVWAAPTGHGPSGAVRPAPTADPDVIQLVHEDADRVALGRYAASTGDLLHSRHLDARVVAVATDVVWLGSVHRGNTLLWSIDLTTGDFEQCFAATAAPGERVPPLTVESEDPRLLPDVATTSAADDDALYVSSRGFRGDGGPLQRLGRDGQILTVDLGGRTVVAGADAGVVHAVTDTGDARELMAVDLVEGAPRWRTELPDAPRLEPVRALPAGDRSYLVTLGRDESTLTAFDPGTGEVEAAVPVGMRADRAVAADGALHLATGRFDRAVAVVRVVDGAPAEPDDLGLRGGAELADVGGSGVVVSSGGRDGSGPWAGVLLVDGEVVGSTEDRLVRVGPSVALLWIDDGAGGGTLVALDVDPDGGAADDDEDTDDQDPQDPDDPDQDQDGQDDDGADDGSDGQDDDGAGDGDDGQDDGGGLLP